MKLSEMRNKVTGLPDGFAGTKKDWKDVAETFRIEFGCMTISLS